ncbi:Regulatory protein [Actinidia chinensis var. chinensis]|uniref:Regulatory protein n=1 Tax=Actinidia chinensis var. chinensis TaxID=1590841 RepID=A0A2R6R0K6_ACTCC|nr:Regulatory protein [Actinidia chinensis var. chinensis]
MKKSPIHPRYEGGDYGFDLQVDFLQFLEEARKHAIKENFGVAAQNPEEAQKRQSGEAKKNKKSWKRSIFSRWKFEKKGNSGMETPTSSHISKPRGSRVSASGPIYGGSGRSGATSCKSHRQTSGPLTSLFQPTKRVEDGIPYICLDKLNNPHDVQSYGPVYLVT